MTSWLTTRKGLGLGVTAHRAMTAVVRLAASPDPTPSADILPECTPSQRREALHLARSTGLLRPSEDGRSWMLTEAGRADAVTAAAKMMGGC